MSPPKGSLSIAFAVIIGVALIGFVSGTSTSDYAFDTPTPDGAPADPPVGLRVAPRYAEIGLQPKGSGSGWGFDLQRLADDTPGVLDEVALAGTDKAVALGDRGAHRAFDGAPPTIPHAVRQDSASECLACHDDGLRLRGRLAPPMSHESHSSCTQCHVPELGPAPGAETLPADPRAVDNAFVGLASPDRGPRASTIAPPQIPHRTFMRERCDSCHGVNGRDAMRSTHPSRQNCQQCHTASAEIDQRPGLP